MTKYNFQGALDAGPKFKAGQQVRHSRGFVSYQGKMAEPTKVVVQKVGKRDGEYIYDLEVYYDSQTQKQFMVSAIEYNWAYESDLR